ncbi:MAG: DUF4224 domain-containing protein [Telluria sp.]
MNPLFLTADELKEMTQRVQRSAQARILNSVGVVYRTRADGSLLVLRRRVEEIFSVSTCQDNTPKRDFIPNWAALAKKTDRDGQFLNWHH